MMIAVDSSVWIDQLAGRQNPRVEILNAYLASGEVVVPDLVLFELLMGLRSDIDAERLRKRLTQLPIVTLGGEDLAANAAHHYRHLRSLGFTIRTGIDMLIGTWCILNGVALLHNDRDYDPMERHLGLKTVASPRA